MWNLIRHLCLSLAVLLVGCQAVPESSSEVLATEIECVATLADLLPERSAEGTGATFEDVDDTPIAGNVEGQVLSLNDQWIMLSRYSTSEAAALVSPDSLQSTFNEGAEILEEVPAAFGDESFRVQLNDELGTEVAIARYADRLVMLNSSGPVSVQELLQKFDDYVLEHVADHSECAYLHPATR